MKTLIVYYSFTQNNEKLARHLQALLNCDIAKIESVKRRTGLSIMLDLMFNRKPAIKTVPYHLGDYDHLIFVAPIWAGKIAMPLKTFLTNEKLSINRYSFVTLCGGSAGQKEKIQNEISSIVGKEPMKVVELWVNDLLSVDKKNTIKNTSGYRIEANGFKEFEGKIRDFVKVISAS